MIELHALLVGVDHYDPQRVPGVGLISDLQGCVRDVERMEAFLRGGPLAVPAGRIRKIVSPPAWPPRPRPAPEDLPTYRNLIREIQALGERARRGDQVLIHYSGHGVSLPTAVPEKKGLAGRDECLVPCNAAEPRDQGGGFLRDLELHALLVGLAERGLRVTLVLDCCHSGGVTRSADRSRVRGLGHLPIPPGAPGPLGPWDALAGSLPDAPAPPGRKTFRNLEGASGWFPQPEGCVLLAACLPTEYAREYPFDDGAWSGALTHFLLEAMADLGPTPTYRWLHHRLLGRIRALFEHQTPVLEGDGDVAFLGREGWSPGAPPSQAGSPEVVLTPVTEPRRCRVATLPRHQAGPAHRKALARVAEAVAGSSAGLLAAAGTAAEADLLVEVTPSGVYRVLDRSGEPLPHQGEAIVAGDPDASGGLVNRLAHVARYLAVRDLENPDPGSPLSGRIHADLFSLERMEDWREPEARVAVGGGAVPVGALLCLLVRNGSRHDVNVGVLDLQPDWGISRAHPNRHEGDFTTLRAGTELPVFLRACLPAWIDEGRDRLLVLAATAPLDLSPLELPPLAHASTANLAASVPRQVRGASRGGTSTRGFGGEWTATSVALDVVGDRPTASRRLGEAAPARGPDAGRWP